MSDWTPSDTDAPDPGPPDTGRTLTIPRDLDELWRRRENRRAHDDDTPRDKAAEQAVLGSILLDAALIEDVTRILAPTDMWEPAHERILDAILAVHARGVTPDAVTVADHLDRTDHAAFLRDGGPARLHDLIGAVAVTGNATWHARIVAERAAARRIVAAGVAIQQLGRTGGPDIAETYARARAEIDKAGQATALASLPDAAAGDTWEPVDLDPILEGVLTGTLTGPRASILTRRDGKALLYPGAVHSISGEPGSCKSWLGLIGAAQEIAADRPVLIIDFEDRGETFVSRLLQLGCKPAHLLAHLRYVRPETALTAASWARLAARADGCRLVIVDGITEAMTMHGLSLMDNEDAARWLALIPNRLANLGCAVLQVDHVVKQADSRGRYSIGAQHKLAGITGTALTALTVKSFGKGERGHTRIVIQKDKHGDVGPAGVTVADFHLDATADKPADAVVAPILAWLDTPQESHDEEGNFRPTVLMKRVSEYLERSPGGSLRAIRMAVKGKGASIDIAVETLIREGYIRVEKGTRDASFHFLIRPFDDKE